MKVDPEVTEALKGAAAALSDAGWEVDEIAPPSIAEAQRINIALWMLDFSVAGTPKLAPEGDPDAIFCAAQMMKIAEGLDPVKALQDRIPLLRAWQMFLEDWPVVLCPMSGEAPFENNSDVRSEADFARIYAAQMTQVGLPALGLPALSVSTGRPGKPMGVQLVGRKFREDVLLEAGAAIEAAHPPIRPVDPFEAG